MRQGSKLMDDLAGMAGGALSVAAGFGEEARSVLRSGIEEFLGRLDLVRREEFEAVAEVAARARAAQEAAETRLAALEARLAALEFKFGTGDEESG